MPKINFSKIINFLSRDKVLIPFIILITGFIYLLTVSPSIYLEDSAEFVTAALTLSIPHPSGYPLYTLLGKLFSFLPILTPVWRINFMSAFFAISALVFFYLVLKELKIQPLISFFTTILLGISLTFWDQATYAEVYSLNAFFITFCLWLILCWLNKKELKYLYQFSFFFGLSLTNHYSMLVLIPGYIFIILYGQPKIIKEYKLIGKMFLLFLLGLSLYLYLPIRSAMNPPIDWFNPENAANFKSVLAYNLARGHVINLDTLKYIGDFINQFLGQFSLFFAILGLVGLFLTFKKNRPLFYFGLINLILLSLGVIIVVVNGLKFSGFIAWFLGILYIPFYIYFAIFIALTFNYVKNFKYIFYPVLILSVIILLFLFEKNLFPNNKSQFYVLEDYSKNLILSLEPSAILLIKEIGIEGDNELFSLAFQKYVQNLRPDITIYSDTPVFLPPQDIKFPKDYAGYNEREQQKIFFELLLKKLKDKNQPIYTTLPIESLANELFSKSNGLVYKIYFNQKEAQENKIDYIKIKDIEKLNKKLIFLDDHAQGLIAKYYYSQASWFMEHEEKEKTLNFINKAIYFDPEPMSFSYRDFIAHRRAYQ